LSHFFLVPNNDHLEFLRLSKDSNHTHVSASNRNLLQGIHTLLRLCTYLPAAVFQQNSQWSITFRSPMYSDTAYRIDEIAGGIRILDVNAECVVINFNDPTFTPQFSASAEKLRLPNNQFSWPQLAKASGNLIADPNCRSLLQALVPLTAVMGSTYPAGPGSALIKLWLVRRSSEKSPSIMCEQSGRLVKLHLKNAAWDVKALSTTGAPEKFHNNPPSFSGSIIVNSPRILIIGGTGVVGSSISDLLSKNQACHITTSQSSKVPFQDDFRHHRTLDIKSDEDLLNILLEFPSIKVVGFFASPKIRPEPEDLYDIQAFEKYFNITALGALKAARVCSMFEVTHFFSAGSSYEFCENNTPKYRKFSSYIVAKRTSSLVFSEFKQSNIKAISIPIFFEDSGKTEFSNQIKKITEQMISASRA
jgi:hypothetical protein